MLSAQVEQLVTGGAIGVGPLVVELVVVMIRLCHDPAWAGSPPDHMTYGVRVGVIDLAVSDESCGAKARQLGVLGTRGL